MSLTTSTSFYQNALGGATPSDITSGALALVPELAYDSWVSVGLTQAPEAGEGAVELIPGDWSTSFEAGNSFTVNDGIGSGWYIVPPVASNGLAGSDNRVLLAQLTTDGILGGSFRTQVFPNGDQVNDVRADISFDQTVDCSALTLELTESTVAGCGSSYVLSRTWTATDDCGNASSATQTITVVDTTSPVLTIPADYTAECSDAHPMDDASATDNCGEVTIDVVASTIPGSGAGCYTITREFTATDDCGNATSATQTITIIDTTSPVLTIPADYTAECSDAHPMDDASATDNCGEVTISVVETTTDGACAGDYTITRAFTATDDCGNATSATQTITIIDTTAPVLTIPADYTAECSDAHPMDDASATDNCGEVTISVVETTTDGACAGDYTITRAFTATDDCGNATSATQTITIIDTTAPVLTIPADYTAECSDAHPMDDASATDNCGEVTIDVVETTIDGACAGDYTITRAFTATDDCGNATSCNTDDYDYRYNCSCAYNPS